MLLNLRIWFASLLVCSFLTFDALGYEIIFSQLSTSNGLSSNFVNCIGQSENGYIWVGTQNGLQRYDGYRFTPTIRSSNKHRLPPLPVNQILKSANSQQLWLRMGQTIGLFNIGDYSFLKAEIENSAAVLEKFNFKLYIDSRGIVFLLIEKYGILVYNDQKNRFEKNSQIINYPKDWSPTCFTEDKEGHIWIGSRLGLGCYDVKTRAFYTSLNNPKKLPALAMGKKVNGVRNVTIDSKKRFFINSWPNGSSYKTYLLDPKKGKLDSVTYEDDHNSNYYELNHITEKNGIIWGYGIHTFNTFDEDERRFTVFYDARNANYGIKVSEIYELFEDRDKNLWVASDNGLYIISILKDNIRNGTTPYFKGADVLFVKPLGTDRFVLGSWGSKIKILQYDGLLHIKPDDAMVTAIYKNAPSDPNFNLVWNAIEVSEKNEVWFGCQLGRIISYNSLKKKSVFIYDTLFNNGTIRTIVQDREHNLWFGLQNGRLIKKTADNKFSLVFDFDHVVVAKIVIDANQNLWVSTMGKGLFYIDPRKRKIIKKYRAEADGTGLSTNHIKDFLPLNDSIMAVACSANLDLLNTKTGKIRQLTVYDGLPQQTITSMQLDQKGFLWMSTIGGICRFNPRGLLFKMYDQKDGLRNSSNLSDLLENSARLQNGSLIFVGPKNFMIFNPSFFNQLIKPKNPIITEFKLFNSFLSVDSIRKLGGISLAHNNNSISVSFASLSYLQSNKLKYFYKLSGANENWYKAENGVAATFASLAPGDYVFMVKAQNSDGIFSPTATLKINIVPAFWQTWWFVVLIIIIFLLPVYFIYKLRLRRLIEVQKIREKVARDLHDDMGSTLTSINILSEMANTKVDVEPAMAKDYLERISKNSSQMMESMDDIVWSIKPANDQLPRIAARMREYTASILEPQDIRYTFSTNETGHHIKLDMDERRNLFLIFKEALNNISKYAQAQNVIISLNYQRGFLILHIKDDGIGFDTQQKSDGNGLINMRKRTELLKGQIQFNSSPNAGTAITIRLPLT